MRTWDLSETNTRKIIVYLQELKRRERVSLARRGSDKGLGSMLRLPSLGRLLHTSAPESVGTVYMDRDADSDSD